MDQVQKRANISSSERSWRRTREVAIRVLRSSRPGKVVRHLVLGRGAGSLAAIEVERLVRVRLRDHLERMAGVRNADRRRKPPREASHACPHDDGLAEQPWSFTFGVRHTSAIH